MGPECVTYNLEAPGHYDVSLRNGENYTLTGYTEFKNGTFDKVCVEKIVLSPPTPSQRVAGDLGC
jgi:hypothetical protein